MQAFLSFFEPMGSIISVFITFGVAFIIASVITKIINKFIIKRSTFLKADPTNFNFLKNSVRVVIYSTATVLVFLRIPELRNLGSAIFAGAGIFAAIIGFASQKAFSNIISGIFIVLFKPFRVGDIIEVGQDKMGRIEEITLRHTIISDFENKRVIIPNSIISEETITNSDIVDERIRKQILIQVSYESNLDLAMKIIADVCSSHPHCVDARTEEELLLNEPIVPVRVIDFAESGINVKAYIWTRNRLEAFILKSDVLQTIKKKFDANNIEIPYPHRVIIHKNQG